MTEILQRMILDGGTTEHPGNALYQAFESIGAEIKRNDDPTIPFDDYYHTPRFAYIRLKVVDAFFEKGLKLLSEMVLQPNLSENAFIEARKDVISLSTNAAMSTPKAADRIFYDNLFKENPGFGQLFGVLVMIFPSFVFFGIQGYNSFVGSDNALAKVDGSPITQQEFDQAQRDRIERLRQTLARPASVCGRIFHAVWNPQVRQATLA